MRTIEEQLSKIKMEPTLSFSYGPFRNEPKVDIKKMGEDEAPARRNRLQYASKAFLVQAYIA